MNERNIISKNIRSMREASGFTQEQVGTHAYLNSIKTGNDKKFIEMYKLYQEKYMKRIQD